MRIAMSLAVLCLTVVACRKPEDDVDPKVRADGYYLAGQTAFLKGDFADAHLKYAEVKKLNPTDPRLPAAEGEVYIAEANIGEAMKAFEEATKLDARRGTNWSRLGYLYSLKGEKEKAQEALAKALAGNPRDFNALETLADLQVKDGKLDEAVKNLVLASEAAPDTSRAELVLRATAELMKKGRGKDALEVLEAAVKRGVKAPEVMSELGDRLAEATRLEEALDAYTQAAKGNPKDPTLWELVGEVNVKLSKLAEAEAAFRESLKVKDRAVVHVSLARLCQTKKDDACLKAELDKALDTASGEELRETTDLAELLVSVGRKKDALSLLRLVSEEPEQKGNLELQLRTARVAKEVGDHTVMKAACVRAGASGHTGKCP